MSNCKIPKMNIGKQNQAIYKIFNYHKSLFQKCKFDFRVAINNSTTLSHLKKKKIYIAISKTKKAHDKI